MTIKPHSPNEAHDAHEHTIPAEVIEEVNRLLAERYYRPDVTVTIYQDELLKLLIARGLSSADLFDKHQLDFETVYEKQGWVVKYDSPAFNESYREYWKFSKKKSS